MLSHRHINIHAQLHCTHSSAFLLHAFFLSRAPNMLRLVLCRLPLFSFHTALRTRHRTTSRRGCVLIVLRSRPKPTPAKKMAPKRQTVENRRKIRFITRSASHAACKNYCPALCRGRQTTAKWNGKNKPENETDVSKSSRLLISPT